MRIPEQLKSRNLVPFKKRQGRYNIPGMTPENQVSMDRVDTDLSPEEQGYIRHYLGYADALIRSAEENSPPEPLEGEFPQSKMVIEERRKAEPPMEEPAKEVLEEPGRGKGDPSDKAA